MAAAAIAAQRERGRRADRRSAECGSSIRCRFGRARTQFPAYTGLMPDGIVGPRTQITLNSLAPEPGIPTLDQKAVSENYIAAALASITRLVWPTLPRHPPNPVAIGMTHDGNLLHTADLRALPKRDAILLHPGQRPA